MIINSAMGAMMITLMCSRLKLMSHKKIPDRIKNTVFMRGDF